MRSRLALGGSGGWIVWQDNATDGDGLGISARRIGGSLSGEFSAFRVNELGVGDQENPNVAISSSGITAFVWQGGPVGMQDIYLRIASGGGTFVTGDILVNSYTNQHQANPSIASLSNDRFVVVWSSFEQDGSLQGIYGRLFDLTGAPVTEEFQINQTTQLNQRDPKVAALSNGKFVVVWVSEALREGAIPEDKTAYAAAIVARIYNANGVPEDGEFRLSEESVIAARPAIASISTGGFMAVWGQYAPLSTNSWDIYTRSFDSNGVPSNDAVVVNEHRYGDQYIPNIAVLGNDALIVWTSLGQDGSYEGVFGRFVNIDGGFLGGEFRVNTTTNHRQMQPAVASDGVSRMLVSWSSFIGGTYSYDLFAQRFVLNGESVGLYPPDAPYVSSLNATEISVTWPELSGYPIDFYELHIDGFESPLIVTGMHAVVGNLAPGTEYTFRMLYQLTDGRRSPLSAPVVGKTWGADLNGDGLPDDWQQSVWGSGPWPDPNEDSDGDGASNLAEFLAGTDPRDPSSVLKTRLVRTSGSLKFSWNTQPGFVYQVQRASNLTDWTNVGSPRYAHGTFDLIELGVDEGAGFYRVICLR